MEEIKLEVETRTQRGSKKIKTIRHKNFIPAVIYGGKMDSTPIQVDRRALNTSCVFIREKQSSFI